MPNFEDEDGEAPKLPTLVPGIRPAYSTPLPVLPMLVLCIVGDLPKGAADPPGYAVRAPLGEPLSAVHAQDGRRCVEQERCQCITDDPIRARTILIFY
jgi:hypothetical protein